MTFVAAPTKVSGDPFTLALYNIIRDDLNKGVMRPIADVVLGVAAASIDFTSIAADWAHLRLVACLRDTQAASNVTHTLRANGDSGANYDNEYVLGNGSVASAAESFAGTYVTLGGPGSTAPASTFSVVVVDVVDYKATDKHKAFSIRNSLKFQNSANGMSVYARHAHWRSTAAINQLTLGAVTTFDVGSHATLYAMGAI